jgi:transposase-like protein
MAAKKASKGKRYTAEEKRQVVDFVNQYNAANGRGGVTAAVKKFGASALTISVWVKAAPSSGKAGKSPAKAGASSTGNRGKILGELSKLDQVIAAKRKELSALEVKFEKLKASL